MLSDAVRDFADRFGAYQRRKPACPPVAVRKLRQRLLIEEALEAWQAMDQGDPVAVASELADVLYVVYGAALAWGVDVDAVFALIHEANMRKVSGGPGEKVKKPRNWKAADVASEIERQKTRKLAKKTPTQKDSSGVVGPIRGLNSADIQKKSRSPRSQARNLGGSQNMGHEPFLWAPGEPSKGKVPKPCRVCGYMGRCPHRRKRPKKKDRCLECNAPRQLATSQHCFRHAPQFAVRCIDCGGANGEHELNCSPQWRP